MIKIMSKYDKFSKEELLALVEKQDNELASKKYGLVWDSEREPEQVVLDCEHNLPILKRVKGKEIKTDKNEDNILIEGDNYHALTVLNYTHQEKIDVIYIDPPYNTGNQDFKYNDRFVDKEDGFRHSKWLNFMEKRLFLAKELLKETGVIFISIDDNEVAQLKMLCDKIFGEDSVEVMIWRKVGEGDAGAGRMKITYRFRVEHEYIIVCYINKETTMFRKTLELPNFKNEYKNPDNDPRGPYKAGNMSKNEEISNAEGKNYYTVKSPAGKKFTRQWHFDLETFEKLNKEGRIYWGKKGDSVPSHKIFINELRPTTPISLLLGKGSATSANKALEEMFSGRVFDNPKPIELISYLLKISSQNNSTILDFFTGTGTTGHAVLELNKEDGGNRKFILCTNNELNGLENELREKGLNEKEIQEHGICRKITYPRLEKVIKGYKKNGDDDKVEELGGNLQYFRTALIKDTKNKDQMRIDLTEKCTEMLCVKENIFNLEKETEDYKIFSSNKGDHFLCVYYNLYDDSFSGFLKEIKKLKGEKRIYMFSMDGKVSKSLFVGVKDFEIEEIPQKIIDVYKQLVKMNIPVKADIIFLEFDKANKKVFENKDKDEGARILRVVLEKTIQKIAQKNGVSIFKENSKEEKISVLNDTLKSNKVFTQVQWEENKTYLTIGNHASHGEYGEYDLRQIEQFYRHIQMLLNVFNI